MRVFGLGFRVEGLGFKGLVFRGSRFWGDADDGDGPVMVMMIMMICIAILII